MRNNLTKGLVKLGKWSLVITFATLITFFLGQYVINAIATHTATVYWHDGSGASPGNRIVATSASTTFNLSVVRASGTDTISNFEVSIPNGWSITDVDEATLVGFSSCSCTNGTSGQEGACTADSTVGKGLRCIGATIGATPGQARFTVRAPSSSQNGTWGWTTTDNVAANHTGNLYTVSLDNGDLAFDIRQASNNELPQAGAQTTLIVSNNTNSTTIVNNTESGDGLFLFESAFFSNRFQAGSVGNYSWTITRGSDFMRSPIRPVVYASGSTNEQRVVMNNTVGLHIGVGDELNTTRTWGDVTISLYNVTVGSSECQESELLFRNTTPSGTNYVNVSFGVTSNFRVYAQANKTGYVNTPCVLLNVSSASPTNLTFAGQFNMGSTTVANCTSTPTMENSYSTCGGLNYTIRASAKNQFDGTLSMSGANASFIGYSTFSTALTPTFFGGDAYLNATGSGRIAVNRTGYVIANTTTDVTTSNLAQKIVIFKDGASTTDPYVAGPALNYTLKVFAFDEANRFIKLGGTVRPGENSNGTIRVNVTAPTTWATEVTFATNGEAYIAALANSTGGYNLSVSKDGYVNRTYVTTPNAFNQTVVYFGNGTDLTCAAAAPALASCANSVLFTVKVTGKNQNSQQLYGFTAKINDSNGITGAQGFEANATDGSLLTAGLNTPGDTSGTADGVIYWAINTSNITNPVRINVTMPLSTGYLEWNNTGLRINDSVQLDLTSYNNFSYYVRVLDEFGNTIRGNLVNNVTFNASSNAMTCSQNQSQSEYWGCNASLGMPTIVAADVNMSMNSGYFNATNRTSLTATQQRWGVAAIDTYTSNYSLLFTTASEFGFGLLGVNVTSVNFTGTPTTSCVQNATNASIWGCNISFSATPAIITVNLSANSGYLNALNSTQYAISSSPTASRLSGSIANSSSGFSLLVTTKDEFGSTVYNPASSNVTNVTSSTQFCFENASNSQTWGCPFNLSLAAPSLVVNITGNQSGYVNGTNRTWYTLPSAVTGSQATVDTGLLYSILVKVADEFGLPIYSPTAGVNISDVTFTANTEGVVTCLKNSTNTSVWGCRVDAGNATGKLAVNFTDAAGFYNYSFLNQPPADSTSVLQKANTTASVYTINVTTLNQFNVSLTGDTNVTFQNNANGGTLCVQSPANATRWGCPIARTSGEFAISVTKPGYINYTTAAKYPNNATITYSSYTVLLVTYDEFNNTIFSDSGVNVTDVTYRNSTGTISCDRNTTNTSSWGCAIPVGFNLGLISVNTSSTSGYMNGTNNTVYNLPVNINTATQNVTTSRNLYSVLIRAQNQFGEDFADTTNVTNVSVGLTGVCRRNSSNSQYWGCPAIVGGEATTIFVNVSAASGYLNQSLLVTPPGSSSTASQTSATSRNFFTVNVTAASELGTPFTPDYVWFMNGSSSFPCVVNSSNSSIWGCAAPWTTMQAGWTNVTADDFINSSSSISQVAAINQNPTAITSANQFTLRVSANGSATGVGLPNANITVYNTSRIFSFPTANVTASDNGLYYFNVSSILNPIVSVLGILNVNSQGDPERGLSISNITQRQLSLDLTRSCMADKSSPTIAIVAPLNRTNVTTTRPNITFTITDAGDQDCGVDIHNITVSGITTFNIANNCTGTSAKYTCSFVADAQTDATNVSFNIDAADGAGNSANRLITQFGVNTANSVTASLITTIRSTAVVNNSYEGGFAFRFNVTTGTGGNATRISMANWTLSSDVNTVIGVSGNAIMNYTDTSGTARTYNIRNAYNESEAVYGLQDLEATSGTQGNVTVYVKIPTGTPSGSYSTTFTFGLYRGA